MKATLGILLAAWTPLAAQTPVITAAPQARPGGIAPPPQPSETGKASIEGKVLDALTHNPIRKATVTLSGRTFLRAATDAEGHFAFRQLPNGQYLLQAQSDQYPVAPFSLELSSQESVTIAADEQASEVALTLTPGASVRGRIVDEEGSPLPQCTVSPMRYRAGDPGPTMVGGAATPSDEKGEYRIETIPAGKYYLVARCFQSIPMPHALVRRDAVAGLPRLTYPPRFYPSSSELAGAARVSLPPGGDLVGIDFQMAPATGITLRGRVRGVLSSGTAQIRLRPQNLALRPLQQQGGGANLGTGEFQIPNVRPGSYELLATAQVEGRSYIAKTAVEVGATAPEPIALVLEPAPQISGSVAIDGDPQVPFNNMRIMMNPLDGQALGPLPQAEVHSDGSFVINASPGHWRLQVNGAPGYVKSVMLGDQEVSATDLEIGPAPAALKIVIGTKNAQVEATITALPAGANAVSGMVWSAGGSEFQQSFGVNAQGKAMLSLPPGRYHACAIAVAQPSVLLNRQFRKVLEGHCQAVEVSEGDRTSIQIPFVPADEAKRLADSLDADDSQVL